jgi:putative zinc ribbon protein
MTDTSTIRCESCSMPIESGTYCEYCVDENGQLQDFDTRFERMTGWAARRDPEKSAEDIEAQTLAFMATLPAWRDHPRVVAAQARG